MRSVQLGQGLTHCPSHSDSDPSCNITRKGEGVLVKCHGGCSQAAVISALKERDLWATVEPSQPSNNERKVAEYVYRLQDGSTVIKERWETPSDGKPSKRFTWPLGTRMEDVRLYHDDEIVNAPLDVSIWLCEGEKAADAVRARNEIATSCPGGSGQEKFGTSFNILLGRRVIIWPDSDEPGRKHRDRLRAELEELGIDTRVFSPANLPPKGDAVEFFQMGRSLDEFKENRLPEVIQRPDATEVIIHSESFPISFVFAPYSRTRGEMEAEITVSMQSSFRKPAYEARINLLSQSAIRDLRLALEAQFGKTSVEKWADVIATAIGEFRKAFKTQRRAKVESVGRSMELRKPPSILHPHVVEGGGTFLFGPPGAGKSTSAMLMAISIDTGSNFIWQSMKRRVLFVNLERSAEQCRFLYSRCLDTLAIVPDHELLMLNARGQTLMDVIDIIRESLWRDGVEVVFVDSITRAGYGDLIDNQAANKACDALNSLEVTWLAIAHSPRGDDTHIFGSAMFDAAADVMVNLIAEQESEGVRGVQIQVTKNNHGPLPRPETWAYEYDEEGIVSVRGAKLARFGELAAKRPGKLIDRVEHYLLEHGESDASSVSESLGVNRSYVADLLNANPRFVKTRRDGRRQFFGVSVKDDVLEKHDPTHLQHDRPTVANNVLLLEQLSIGNQHSNTLGSEGVFEPQNDQITCWKCKRGGMRLGGYDSGSTAEIELPLCVGCNDEASVGHSWRAPA